MQKQIFYHGTKTKMVTKFATSVKTYKYIYFYLRAHLNSFIESLDSPKWLFHKSHQFNENYTFI